MGGHFAAELKYAGFDAIIIEGNPEELRLMEYLIDRPEFELAAAASASTGARVLRNGIPPVNPITWWTHAESLANAPLKMQYDELDRTATYKLRVCYMGDTPAKIRLTADDDIEIHPLLDRDLRNPLHDFDIPQTATADGKLTLTWHKEPGLGRNGRGCQVSEAWLIRN
jgi:hypothetical protein